MMKIRSRITPVLVCAMFTRKVSSLSQIPIRPFTNVKTRFVLVETRHPGNVGAAARALKTMGFDDLALVRPHDEKVLGRKKCIDGASGAVDILKKSNVYGSIDEMFRGEQREEWIICGTGMPNDMALKRTHQRYLAPRRFFEDICSDTKGNRDLKIAFLFGNERFGMDPEDIEECSVMLGIPTNPEFGSLNVANAVQIVAYDWREATGGFDIKLAASR